MVLVWLVEGKNLLKLHSLTMSWQMNFLAIEMSMRFVFMLKIIRFKEFSKNMILDIKWFK
jgi:hypothetical protein